MSKDSLSNKSDLIESSSIFYRCIKSTILILGTITVFFIGQVIGILLLITALRVLGFSGVLLEDLVGSNNTIKFLAVLLIESVTISILYLIYQYRKQDFFKEIGLSTLPKLSDAYNAVTTYGIYFLSYLFIALLISEFVPAINVDQAQQLGIESPEGFGFLIVFFTLVALPAIAEEIIFRGVLFKKLTKLIDVKVAVLLTSIVFGVAHLEFLNDGPLNLIAGIDTLIFSFFLCWLALRTKSLWAPIILHAIKNTIAFVVLFVI